MTGHLNTPYIQYNTMNVVGIFGLWFPVLDVKCFLRKAVSNFVLVLLDIRSHTKRFMFLWYGLFFWSSAGLRKNYLDNVQGSRVEIKTE